MNFFVKKYKELLIMLLPLYLINANWYSSMRLNEDWSAMIPYKGYEFLFYNRGEAFLLTYLLTVIIQIMALKYPTLRICSIIGHVFCVYCLLIFPIIFIGTYTHDIYSFYRIGAYVAVVCEILVIILNVFEIIKNKICVWGRERKKYE